MFFNLEQKSTHHYPSQNEDETEEVPPKGTFLHFTGVTEGSEVTREDLKEALGEAQEQCAWVDYSRGMTQGYLRFKEPESNKTIMEKLDGKLKVLLNMMESTQSNYSFPVMMLILFFFNLSVFLFFPLLPSSHVLGTYKHTPWPRTRIIILLQTCFGYPEFTQCFSQHKECAGFYKIFR